jgi:dihydrofolate synthase/folylpolyglutamate synthase
MNLEQSLNKLFSLHTFGIKLGLDNIKKFLNEINNPEKKLKAFHLAGSNGKGSTSSFIASILMEMGFKVGLYTSPHFVRFNERIMINNHEIPDDYISRFIIEHEKHIDEFQLTFFEVTTAMAFKYFADKKVDFAVIETGLGGRLDATNVLNPLAVVITSISLEHTNVLGTTIPEIAFEKAAIIKPGAKVFIGRLPEQAEILIESKTNANNCELFELNDYINIKDDTIELYTEEIELDDWSMPLRGIYQKFNAALAALTVTKTLDYNNPRVICHGIKNVIKNTNIQGRYEFYRTKPDIIFDSAHNLAGVENFLSEFKKHSKNYSRRILLFGVMKDKSIREMLKTLNEEFEEIYITQINYERAASTDNIIEAVKDLNLDLKICTDKIALISEVEKGNPANCLVVLGSMYLLGEIKSELSGKT